MREPDRPFFFLLPHYYELHFINICKYIGFLFLVRRRRGVRVENALIENKIISVFRNGWLVGSAAVRSY